MDRPRFDLRRRSPLDRREEEIGHTIAVSRFSRWAAFLFYINLSAVSTYTFRICGLLLCALLGGCSSSRYQARDADLLWVHTTAPVSHQLSHFRVFERETRLYVQASTSGRIRTVAATAAEDADLRQRISNIHLKQDDIDQLDLRKTEPADAQPGVPVVLGLFSPEHRIEIMEPRGTRELLLTNPARFASREPADETSIQVRQLLDLVRKLTDMTSR